jgi:hypothetical protein
MDMRHRAFGALVLACALLGTMAAAQGQGAPTRIPDLSGAWSVAD